MKRRLFAGEREVVSLGSLTLTTHRVILRRRGSTTAIMLGQVCATTIRTRFGRTVLEVRSSGARLVQRCDDPARARSVADTIDAQICLATVATPATDRACSTSAS